MRLLFILLLLIPTVGFTQLQTSNLKHNFGDLYDNAPTFADFTFKNTSGVPVFLLTIDKPQEVYYIYSKKIIQPDSTMVIRLKVNDRIKGKFSYRVDAYFSDSNEPTPIILTGNIKEKATNSMTGCPDFSRTPPAGGLAEFEITIKVIDSLTRKPIRKSKVYLINNGRKHAEYTTDKDGLIHRKVPLGYYYITAHKDSYNSNFHEGYLNFQSNYVEIELQQPKTEEPLDIIPVDNPILVSQSEDEPILIDSVVIEEPIDIVIIEEPVLQNDTLIDSTTSRPPEKFDSQHYVPNNIVFIVDMSSSMNAMGKLDLLKLSMIELTKILRTEDRVTLIAYSGSVRILLEDISGDNKEEIIYKVNSLTAKGYTNGGEAIKEGYRLVNKSYIDGGNNMVFMVTDGAFNKGQQDYKKAIKSNYKKRNILFSVVGIKTTDFLTTNMNSMAKFGGGKYVRIITKDDAENKLFDEIRRTSYKN